MELPQIQSFRKRAMVEGLQALDPELAQNLLSHINPETALGAFAALKAGVPTAIGLGTAFKRAREAGHTLPGPTALAGAVAYPYPLLAKKSLDVAAPVAGPILLEGLEKSQMPHRAF